MPAGAEQPASAPGGPGAGSSTAVVTGGARGIGATLASRLAQAGWSVVAADIDPSSEDGPGDGVELRRLDVTDHAAVTEFMAALVAERGGIGLLVNNAGITRAAPLAELPLADWRAVVDVNLNGVFNCLQQAGRHMLAAGRGVIVNISSVAAERGSPERAPYSATKAAINGLTRAAAVEWAERGVRVNAVGPGYIATGVFAAAVAGGRLREADVLGRTPARRLGTIDEVADAVLFLASDAARFITGQVLYVDGGFLADFGVPPVHPPAPA